MIDKVDDILQLATSLITGGIGLYLYAIGETLISLFPLFWAGIRIGWKLKGYEELLKNR